MTDRFPSFFFSSPSYRSQRQRSMAEERRSNVDRFVSQLTFYSAITISIHRLPPVLTTEPSGHCGISYLLIDRDQYSGVDVDNRTGMRALLHKFRLGIVSNRIEFLTEIITGWKGKERKDNFFQTNFCRRNDYRSLHRNRISCNFLFLFLNFHRVSTKLATFDYFLQIDCKIASIFIRNVKINST